MAAPLVPPAPPSGSSVPRYALAVVLTVLAIGSQYFLPQRVPALLPAYSSLLGDLGIVYGIPILAFLALVGIGPLTHWRRNNGLAALEGLRWYGALTVVSLAVVFALTVVYIAVDPGALALLNKTNPALAQAEGNPWFFVVLSFAIGAIEETIFRGWVFGFWAARGGWWVVPAVWTSALFAGVHLYYGTTYGIVAPLIFPSLFFVGFGFAAAFRASGGNLVVIGLLHGAFDAAAFLSIVNYDAGLASRYLLVLVGIVLFLLLWMRHPGSPWRPLGSVAAAVHAAPVAETPPLAGEHAELRGADHLPPHGEGGARPPLPEWADPIPANGVRADLAARTPLSGTPRWSRPSPGWPQVLP